MTVQDRPQATAEPRVQRAPAAPPQPLLERLRTRVVTVSAEVGVRILAPIERWIGRRSPVGDTPFYDVRLFARAAELERHWTEIRAELETVLEDRGAIPAFQDISVDQIDLSDDDRWKTYFLYGYGFEGRDGLPDPRRRRDPPLDRGRLTRLRRHLRPRGLERHRGRARRALPRRGPAAHRGRPAPQRGPAVGHRPLAVDRGCAPPAAAVDGGPPEGVEASPDRRSRKDRTLWRLPHTFMSHHTALRLRERS